MVTSGNWFWLVMMASAGVDSGASVTQLTLEQEVGSLGVPNILFVSRKKKTFKTF